MPVGFAIPGFSTAQELPSLCDLEAGLGADIPEGNKSQNLSCWLHSGNILGGLGS